MTDTVADMMESLALDGDWSAVAELCKRNNVNINAKYIKRIVRERMGEFRCLSCPNVYDSYGELAMHLRKKKKHLKAKSEIKTLMADFRLRIRDKYVLESDEPIVVSTLTKGEIKTFINICLVVAYMVKVFSQ